MALALAALAALVAPDAAGQDTAPRSLIPVSPATGQPEVPQPETAPSQPPDPAAGPTAPTSSEATSTADTITIGQLAAPDPASIGLMTERDGGLGVEMWRGTPRALVELLLPRLPVGHGSAALTALARRLLLSTATPPAGPGGENLLELRIERLAAMGDLDSVTALLRQVPESDASDMIARADIERRWLVGDFAGACAIASDMLDADGGNEWLAAMAFCQVLDQRPETAQLAVSLLREEGMDDPAFFTLIDALTGNSENRLESLARPTPLHLAMLRAARQAVPDDALDGSDPAMLAAIARAPNASVELRLAAAERAQALGTLPARDLGQVYVNVPFTAEERANALAIAERLEPAKANALLYQVAQIEAVPTARAEALATAWSIAWNSDRYPTVARVNRGATLDLEPVPELVWIAADAGRALLLTGDVDQAYRWMELARQQATPANPDAVKAVIDLWPLLQLADWQGRLPWSPEVLGHWWDATQDQDMVTRIERGTILFTLFEALGYDIPRPLWLPLLGGPVLEPAEVPRSGLWQALEDAAAGGRQGEVVLLGLILVGQNGPAGTNLKVLHDVVRGLRAVGLDRAAREIALEAAVAHGF